METTLAAPRVTYLNVNHTVASWLLTKDHKRIGIMYLVVVSIAFFVGGIFASLIRMELATPAGDLVSSDTYNRLFTMHGIMMVFFVLIPAVPAILGNFVLPLMLRAGKNNPPRRLRLRHRHDGEYARHDQRRRRHGLDLLSAVQHGGLVVTGGEDED